MFPTADQIALALVTACRLTKTNPVMTAMGYGEGEESRGRHIALAGLIEAFPEARKKGLARCLGYRSPDAAASNLNVAFRPRPWWREEWVDEVVGALVADQYGEQAE